MATLATTMHDSEDDRGRSYAQKLRVNTPVVATNHSTEPSVTHIVVHIRKTITLSLCRPSGVSHHKADFHS